MSLVSIIIPLFNQWPYTKRCLDALERTAPDAEVVLVDNGSTDATKNHTVTVKNPANLGFAVACNQGAWNAAGDVLVFLNNDTEPLDGWLDPLIAPLAEGYGAAGAKLIYPHGLIQHAGVDVDLRLPPGKEAQGVQKDLPSRDVDAVTGACLAIHRELFLSLGGFDEGYWNGYEDVDLCLSVRAAGYPIRYVRESVVIHHESRSGPERWSKVRENVFRLREKWSADV